MGKPGRSGDFFWVSYSDLMTSLFFVMLVLYVLTFVLLKIQQGQLQADADQLAKIKEIQEAVNSIDSQFFAYDPIYRKHVLNIPIRFPSGGDNIYSSNSVPTRLQLEDAGKRIIELVEQRNQERVNRGDKQVQFLVIIEGQASRDGFSGNDELSYRRALSLLRFWETRAINMNDRSDIELIVAGSGEGGLPRAQPDRPPKNQRFLIHIIPKVGEI